MSEISDEIRRRFGDSPEIEYVTFDRGGCDKMRELADRIDREMVELPLSADRKIWTGREECFWIEARGGAWSRHSLLSLDLIDGSRWYVRGTGGLGYEAVAAWFERPDSFERIADDLDEVVDAAGKADDMCEMLANFADRIRRLAAKEGE